MKLSVRSRFRTAMRYLRGEQVPVRRTLPHRRVSETVKFTFADRPWFATVSRFPDGSIAELFLDTAKPGDQLRGMANDMAVLASLALQYGCPPEVIRDSLTRNERLEPRTPICAILDEVVK